MLIINSGGAIVACWVHVDLVVFVVAAAVVVVLFFFNVFFFYLILIGRFEMFPVFNHKMKHVC